jgi:hypothetical protein
MAILFSPVNFRVKSVKISGPRHIAHKCTHRNRKNLKLEFSARRNRKLYKNGSKINFCLIEKNEILILRKTKTLQVSYKRRSFYLPV